MRTTSRVAAVLGTATAAMLIVSSPAFASSPDDKAGTNRDWGTVSSNLAQLDTSHSFAESDGSAANGGAHGQHSRSTRAADINGGFAYSDNEFGITFNVREPGETNNGRDGVGNVTRDPDGPHHTDPGDGGLGVHALNNAEASAILDPVTGDFTVNAGGDMPDFSAELLDGTSVNP